MAVEVPASLMNPTAMAKGTAEILSHARHERQAVDILTAQARGRMCTSAPDWIRQCPARTTGVWKDFSHRSLN